MARLCFRSTSCHSTPSAKLVWLKADVSMACQTSANWRGGLGSKYYPTSLHCEHTEVACLSEYLPFSNWGKKQKFIAFFFKALAQHIFKHVCNTLFLPISSSFGTIYSLQERRMRKAHLMTKDSGKACLPPKIPPSLAPVGRLTWSHAPFAVWSLDFFQLTCTSDKGLGSRAYPDHAVLFPALVMLSATAGKRARMEGEKYLFNFVVKTC